MDRDKGKSNKKCERVRNSSMWKIGKLIGDEERIINKIIRKRVCVMLSYTHTSQVYYDTIIGLILINIQYTYSYLQIPTHKK